jgi:hypothetical protein
MTPQPYNGSCHCSLITYTATLDLQTPDTSKTGKCNCSICTKTRSWEILIPPSDFHLNPESTQYLTEYRFGTKKIAHLFCKLCGCRPFGRGVWESDDWSGGFVAISLACLDGVGDEVLAGLEVVYRNGREGKFGERPAVVGHL